MVKNLSHNSWVLQQFEAKYLISSYRNVLIHVSIIEGVLRNESNQDGFNLAIKFLFNSGKITTAEKNIFNEIRDKRNELVHDSFRKGLDQNVIDGLRDNLMEKIHEAYQISNMLEEKLFKKYLIVRTPRIALSR